MVGYALGGEAGCRLAVRLGIPISPDTVLRKIDRNDLAAIKEPKVIGVDDWAWRKGHRYGSILVDLETRRPIDLLPDRSADSFASWLKEHPTVELISRDRAEAYADGGRRGASGATQVADRFHLLCNLTSAIERVLETKRSELCKACEPAEIKTESGAGAEVPPNVTMAQERSKQSRERRLDRYSKVLDLQRQGLTNRAIGRALHMGRKTVGRFLLAGQFPERAKPHRPGPRVNKFRDYLQKRWAEGCHNATKLWHEIQLQGYVGGRSMVATLVSTFRTPGAKCHRQNSRPPASKPKGKPLSPRQAAMLIARNPEKLDDDEQELITRLESLSHCRIPAAISKELFRGTAREGSHRSATLDRPSQRLGSASDKELLQWTHSGSRCCQRSHFPEVEQRPSRRSGSPPETDQAPNVW